MAKTFDTDLLPDATGKDLGSSSQRWDLFGQNLDVSGTVTLTGALTTAADVTGDQLISTALTGTIPVVVSSTTKCTNLNADLLDGSDWAAPAALGSTTPAAASVTTLTTTGNETVAGDIQFTNAANRNINFSAASTAQRNLIVSGCDSTAAPGGSAIIQGGDTTNSGSSGGVGSLIGGDGFGAGTGGQVNVTGGLAGTTGGGGPVVITGGAGGATSGAGGVVQLISGAGSGGNANSGVMSIQSGVPNGTGNFGAIQIVPVTGIVCAAGGVASAVTTAVTVNANVTTDQNLMAYTVQTKGLNRAGALLRVRGFGIYSTQAAQTPTLTLKVKLGSVTLASWVCAATSASQTDKPWSFDFSAVTATTGATGTLEAHGVSVIQIGTGAAGADANLHGDANVAASSALDLTASNSLQITATFSTNASPSNSATQRLMTVEVY